MKITERIFQSFVRCPYKAHLLLKGTVGQKSDHEILQDDLHNAYISDMLWTDNDQPSCHRRSTSNSRSSSLDGKSCASA